MEGKGFYSPYGSKVSAANRQELSYYVRGGQWDDILETWGNGVITAPVSVEKMHQWRKDHPDAFIAALKGNE